jgi:hypothetical protein
MTGIDGAEPRSANKARSRNPLNLEGPARSGAVVCMVCLRLQSAVDSEWMSLNRGCLDPSIPMAADHGFVG